MPRPCARPWVGSSREAFLFGCVGGGSPVPAPPFACAQDRPPREGRWGGFPLPRLPPLRACPPGGVSERSVPQIGLWDKWVAGVPGSAGFASQGPGRSANPPQSAPLVFCGTFHNQAITRPRYGFAAHALSLSSGLQCLDERVADLGTDLRFVPQFDVFLCLLFAVRLCQQTQKAIVCALNQWVH
jgi:hypothetical protein